MATRSEQKRITVEAKTLRHMRHSRGMSLNEAGRECGISGSAIAHIEQGRMDVSSKRIETMVAAYGFTMDQFYEYIEGKTVPINFRDESIALLRELDEARLPMVHALLLNLR